MRILAIDSSGLVATVAVVEEENEISKTIAEYTINYKKTHSQTLLPMLDEIVKMTDMNLDTIDAIAVAGGPGSFTGLRIGSATAKGLGLALKKPLIHIPTVDGLAYNLCYTDRIICPIMDARRNQVYTGIYQMDGDKLQVLEAQMAVEIDELAKKLCTYGKPVIFLGDGVPVHKDRLEKELMTNYDIAFAPAHMNQQRAAAVGMLGIQYYKEGKTETASRRVFDNFNGAESPWVRLVALLDLSETRPLSAVADSMEILQNYKYELPFYKKTVLTEQINRPVSTA